MSLTAQLSSTQLYSAVRCAVHCCMREWGIDRCVCYVCLQEEDPRYNLVDSGVDESTMFGWQTADTSEVTRTGMKWYLSYRNEISWSVDCPQTRQSVKSVRSRVNSISAAQLVVTCRVVCVCSPLSL